MASTSNSVDEFRAFIASPEFNEKFRLLNPDTEREPTTFMIEYQPEPDSDFEDETTEDSVNILVTGDLRTTLRFLKKLNYEHCIYSPARFVFIASDLSVNETLDTYASSTEGESGWQLEILLKDVVVAATTEPPADDPTRYMLVQDEASEIHKCLDELVNKADGKSLKEEDRRLCLIAFSQPHNKAARLSFYPQEPATDIVIRSHQCPHLMQSLGAKALTLHCMNIGNFPEYLADLSCLKTLCLTGTLGTLPESIGKLAALEHFTWTSKNNPRMSTLPRSFSCLQSLKTLELSDLVLNELPTDIGYFSCLESIVLNGVQNLTILPESFGSLESLKHLEICGGSLSSLPATFAQLQSLESLNLCYLSNMHSLPPSFGQLPNLHSIDFSEMENLTELPDSFSQLGMLREICFEGLGLETLPETFGELSRLEEFTFCGLDSSPDAFQRLPDSFCQLSSLKKLQMSYLLSLTTLPSNFCLLPALEELQLFNLGIKSIPTGLTSLMHLKTFEFTLCSEDVDIVQAIPPNIGQMELLETLEIKFDFEFPDTTLVNLPSSFLQLINLKSLFLGNAMGLATLPESFGMLKNLERLKLMSLGIKELPESMGELSSLKKIWLCDLCHLKALPNTFGHLESLQVAKFVGKTEIKYVSVANTIQHLIKMNGCYGQFVSKEGHLAALWTLGSIRATLGSTPVQKNAWPMILENAEKLCHCSKERMDCNRMAEKHSSLHVEGRKRRKVCGKPSTDATPIFWLLKEFAAQRILAQD